MGSANYGHLNATLEVLWAISGHFLMGKQVDMKF